MTFQSYNTVRQQFIDHWDATGTVDNQAASYEIVVGQPGVGEGEKYWACIGAYHLLPEENGGKHNLYLEAIDENNNRLFGVAFKWGWEGQGPNEPSPDVVDDKPPSEQANIVIWANQVIWAGVRDSIPSGEVQKIRSTHPDEGPGNTWGHHSFYVAFKRVTAGGDGGNGNGGNGGGPVECEEAKALARQALHRIETAEAELALAKQDLNAILRLGQ